MSFTPMKSSTEGVVDAEAGFMEFDLTSNLGYQEWRGMFAELGVKATLFNGYLLQKEGRDAQISTTPVQLHLFEEDMYLAPPFESREYYFHLPLRQVRLGKVYFRIPPEVAMQSLDGHKPAREDLYAIDIWVVDGDAQGPAESGFSASSLLKGNDVSTLQSAEAQAPASSDQMVYSLLYEARIKTDMREYHINRFESEQLFGAQQPRQ